MYRVLPFVALATALACSSGRAQPPAAGGAEPAARIGDRAVSLQDLEEQWRKSDPAEHQEATFKVYEGRRKALDGLVADQLFEQAAKGRGLSPAAYEEAEVSKRAKEVTDADVASFYTSNIREMQGQTLGDMAPLITRFLTEQNRLEARKALVAELRKAGPPVRMLLEAPRYTIALGADDPALGKTGAAITVVEFSDFQCPYCLQAMPTLKRLQQTYGDRVRVIWKDFPLVRIHPQASKAAEAAHCAGEQGKFWPYHDRLFANQAALQVDALKKYAQDTSLDVPRFNACLDSSKFAGRVQEGIQLGQQLGVSSTPTLFVNGRVLPGAYPYDDIAAVVDEELERLK